MLLNFLSHLLAFDIAWIVALILNNLFFLFAFTAIMYYFMEGKRVLLGFFVITFVMWIWGDMENAAGLVIFATGFLSLYYITKVAVLAAAEHSPALKNKLIIVSEIQAIALVIIFNLFMVGG